MVAALQQELFNMSALMCVYCYNSCQDPVEEQENLDRGFQTQIGKCFTEVAHFLLIDIAHKKEISKWKDS